jgi:hypothetical protein
MKKNIIVTISSVFIIMVAGAQSQAKQFPFTIRLEQMEINNMPALQSYAFATWQGKWLLVGGRKDGLHRRQPWATFDEDGQNKFIYVVDPVKKQVWKRSLDKLPVTIQEQLQSTNMEFIQSGNRLILAGGYGYSKTADDHITYPYLAVLQVDELIQSVINGKPLGKYIVQARDERMAVTGGRLAKIADTFLLAGGQRFDGRYNPHGPDHGPGFTQQYTNEIRKFMIEYDQGIPLVKNYSAIKDTVNLHRRDYNLVPQVFKNDELGFTMFSGVFQYHEDIPFTNFVDIKGGSYTVNNSFDQRFSHYHNAVLPMYDRVTGTMYSIFFGGIARYFTDSAGKIFENKDVPFTKTISVVARKGEEVHEMFLPQQMPGYLGAAAEFIFMPETVLYKEGIADARLPENQEILIGYILGGINSSAGNIFFENTGEESKANSKIIKVYIVKTGR